MSLLDQLLALTRWKRLILWNTLLVGAASIVIALLLPKTYKAGASIFPPEEDAVTASSLGSLLSASALAGRGANLPLLATPSDVYAAILKSRTLREELIRGHDLVAVYRTIDLDHALRVLNEAMKIKVGGEGVVTVTFFDQSAARAADLANSSILILDRMNRAKRHTSAGQARAFIERRLADNVRDLAAAEDTLRNLQKSTRVLVPDQQAAAVISAAAEIEVQLLMKEVELGVVESQLGTNHPDRLALAREVLGLRRRMGEMESGHTSRGADNRFEIPFQQYPDLTLGYVRALRAVKVQETIYEFLVQQYEQFRIQESRDTPTVQILDRAVPPTMKSKPVRWLICVSASLLAFFFAASFAATIELLRRMRAEAPERFQKFESVARELGLRTLFDRL